MIEGPEAWERFKNAVRKIVSVTKDELKRRDAQWHQQREKAARRRKR
jgi:hypothetical protein